MSKAQSNTSGAMIGCVALCGNLMAISVPTRWPLRSYAGNRSFLTIRDMMTL